MSRRRRDIENEQIIHDIYASIFNCLSTSARTWQKTQFVLFVKKITENTNHSDPSTGNKGPEWE